MCGIAGIWGEGDIRAMTECLAHRGPDDHGYHEDGALKLGVRRLNVIDLVTGHQPIRNEDGTIWIVHNGEIFNYRELRKELEPKHRFYTKTDTEVIVHAYEEWGRDCLARFIGMFAFAVWDGRELFIARDRLGEKPLYYCRHGRRFLFASEIKALLREVPAEPVIDEEYLVFETPLLGNTMFRDIRSLEPGCCMVVRDGEPAVSRYWEIEPFDGPRRREADYVEELRWLIGDSVRLRLRSDVPLGVFLSGGLDSSLIACLARPEKVFSCRFPLGDRYDEFSYAAMVARAIGAEHLVIEPTAEDFRRDFPRVLYHLDHPIATPSSIAEFALARLAKPHVKVVLGGQGADEIFGGYVRYLLMLEEARLAEAPILRSYLPLARHFWSERMFRDPCERYFDLVRRGDDPSGRILGLFRGIFERQRSLIDRMGYTDLKLTFPSLITMNDKAVAAVGLENRTPFLDHRIVEFAFRLPPEMKVRGFTTKHILREAARGIVPDAVIEREDKKGLVVPLNRWFDGELGEWCRELADSLARRGVAVPRGGGGRGEFDRSRYAAISLELWLRTFFGGAPPPGAGEGARPPRE
ncbi:MAG: asparagine synthase (glutamine-hydrolyzing) [bacterium]|nr:asparagine synthase (glutamine-hydrolyzing) [bacterium]